jgi:glycosyltransferase involved in cell wall biosynthesis
MASGCAVVATSVAASGMSAEVNEAILIRDTPEEMAAAILALLQDPAKRKTLGAKARHFVRRNYDWSVLIPRLLKAYEGIGLG